MNKAKLPNRNHPFGSTSLINWIFDDVLTKDAFNTGTSTHSVLSAFNTPRMNILENDSELILELAIPGLEKKDINIDIRNGGIHISAKKSAEKDESEKKYKAREFNYGSFKRSYRIPEHISVENISAEYTNGILNVTLPKTEAGKNGLSVKVK